MHSVKLVLESILSKKPKTDVELMVLIHDFVRDYIKFGFTIEFETITPQFTLENRVGHCNAQADLICLLMREAGFNPYLKFMSIEKTILLNVLPSLLYHFLPKNIYHSAVQISINGRNVIFDSYILDRFFFIKQKERLEKSGLRAGFGLHQMSTCEWNGYENAFSQAREDECKLDNHLFYDLNDATKSLHYKNSIMGLTFNSLLSLTPNFLYKKIDLYMNSKIRN